MADGYTVIDQLQTVGQLPDRTFGPVVRVTFRTPAGIVQTVDVPAAGYNAELVRTMIDERLSEIQKVADL